MQARDSAAVDPPGGPASQSVPDALIGRVINDRYRIVELLARGGMGKVYRAEQAPLGRAVALKVLHPNYKGDNDPEFHKRFFLEAATCAKLTHPNTVTIFDYGRSDDDIYFIAMELLEGKTLYRALRDDGIIDPRRALHITRQVCRSLREAHGLHIVHRDLKPANVFLITHDDDSDFVKVLDFGLVKNVEDNSDDLTQTGLFMGSPKYMAPEQIQGEKADGRVDVYALGVMLYEMLTGKVPFDRPNSVNILMAHVHEAPPPFAKVNPALTFPAGLEDLVMRALAKKPSDRFANMEEFLKALKVFGDSLGDSQSVTSTTSRELPTPESRVAPRVQAPDATVRTPQRDLDETPAHPSRAPSRTPDARPTVEASPSSPSKVPPAITETRASGTPWVWPALVGALVVAVGGMGAWIATRQPPTTAGTSGAPSVSPEAMTPPTPAIAPETRPIEAAPVVPDPPAVAVVAPPAEVVTSLRLHLVSNPSGAAVRLGNTRIGVTPLDHTLDGPEASDGAEVVVTFSRTGYQPLTVRRPIAGRELSIEATLSARVEPTVTMVEGYRDDPYE